MKKHVLYLTITVYFGLIIGFAMPTVVNPWWLSSIMTVFATFFIGYLIGEIAIAQEKYKHLSIRMDTHVYLAGIEQRGEQHQQRLMIDELARLNTKVNYLNDQIIKRKG